MLQHVRGLGLHRFVIQSCLCFVAVFAERPKVVLLERIRAHPERDDVVDVEVRAAAALAADRAPETITAKDVLAHKRPPVVAGEFVPARRRTIMTESRRDDGPAIAAEFAFNGLFGGKRLEWWETHASTVE